LKFYLLSEVEVTNTQWSRGTHGILAGVCYGFAKRFQIDITLVRLAWVFSVLCFGVGLGLYLILAVSLPREDKLNEAYSPRIMGVCSRFARRFDLDLGLTRAVFFRFFFFFICKNFLAYIKIY
jgi:phage shock protein C